MVFRPLCRAENVLCSACARGLAILQQQGHEKLDQLHERQCGTWIGHGAETSSSSK